MAMEPERWNDLAIPGVRPGGPVRAKPKSHHQDMYLCVALVVLVAWAVLSVIF